MRRVLTKTALVAVALPGLLLTGCEYTVVDSLNKMQTSAQTYPAYLADDYKALANYEGYQMYDWRDARHFASKGIHAAKGQVVNPDNVERRDIKNAHVRTDLQAGRARLVSALNGGATTKAPKAVARAQVEYDCWAEQAEEGFQYNDIAACRNGFIQAMMVVDRAMAQPVASAQPTPAPMLAAPAAARDYIVFFDFDSAELTSAARDIINTAAQVAKREGIRTIHLVGHADRSGTSRYNQALSMRRAESVARELQRLGFDRRDMMLTARGESEPLVETPDGVREPQNRRVTINIDTTRTGA